VNVILVFVFFCRACHEYIMPDRSRDYTWCSYNIFGIFRSHFWSKSFLFLCGKYACVHGRQNKYCRCVIMRRSLVCPILIIRLVNTIRISPQHFVTKSKVLDICLKPVSHKTRLGTRFPYGISGYTRVDWYEY
jgi:hypothetical protein